MILVAKEHNHDFLNYEVSPPENLGKCYSIVGYWIIGLQSELDVFETWCVNALAWGWRPLGGIQVTNCEAEHPCRRQAFAIQHNHVRADFVEKMKELKAEYDAL